MKKEIYMAINRGVDKALIDFDNDTGFKKTSGKPYLDIKEFHVGDYVLYDYKVGYNNYVGDRAGVCICDKPDQEIYIASNHLLTNNEYKWANNGTLLGKTLILPLDTGLLDTEYILNTYLDDIDGTLWEKLKDGEFIPNINELLHAYNILKRSRELQEKAGIDFQNNTYNYYWSSTCSDKIGIKCLTLKNFAQYTMVEDKFISAYSIVFLNIK